MDQKISVLQTTNHKFLLTTIVNPNNSVIFAF